MADKLFQARQQYYAAERAALEQWIDDQVLEAEARRQHVTVKELLERNVNAHITDPTDDQLRVYTEGVNTDQPFEAVRDKVLQHIREARTAKAHAAYVKSLRERHLSRCHRQGTGGSLRQGRTWRHGFVFAGV
ncbi:MAG: hypothetical protein LAP39_14815 [Acidobacteriia bacterium]|nr:hypothetical protein [Terriglobia bacterium]